MDEQTLKEEVQKALDRAYFYLKFRQRTRKEVSDYLAKKAARYRWPDVVRETAIKELEEQGLIDDRKFVEWYVESRNATLQRSAFALKAELLKHGVSKDLIDEYFTQSPVEEDALALEALKKKWSRFERLDKRERFQKAAAFLSRRGFSFDRIKTAIQVLEDDG